MWEKRRGIRLGGMQSCRSDDVCGLERDKFSIGCHDRVKHTSIAVVVNRVVNTVLLMGPLFCTVPETSRKESSDG